VRCAYISATIFIAASGATNITYGWSKGDSLATSVVWAGVAGAVAIVLALSVPALMRSVEARRWFGAAMALAALLLSGTYSVTAALGSAAGGRQNAATAESATADARKRLQGAYDAAKAELDALRPSRPVGELEALVAGAKPVCREVQDFKSRRTECSPPAALVAELGRAKRRAELESKIERVSGDLVSIQPTRMANSDAKALTRYLGALGVEVSPDRLNDLLVLLSVVMIEAGGSLALALGMALNAAPAERAAPKPDKPAEQCPDAVNTAAPAIKAVPAPVFSPGVQAPPEPAPGVQAPDLLALVTAAGGSLRTTTRRLGVQLGRPAATVHGELRRLAGAGLIALNPDSRGTLITLKGPSPRGRQAIHQGIRQCSSLPARGAGPKKGSDRDCGPTPRQLSHALGGEVDDGAWGMP
jgi:hypothetical protein